MLTVVPSAPALTLGHNEDHQCFKEGTREIEVWKQRPWADCLAENGVKMVHSSGGDVEWAVL